MVAGKKHIHFLGIGGSGASSAAAIAEAQGYHISGCDIVPLNEFTQNFNKDILFKGHSASHMECEKVDLLAITPAILSLDPNNEELIEAKKRKIKILTWQQFSAKYLQRNKFVIAVAGTHGKTTTTAMIGQVLEDASLDPTIQVGTIIPKWGNNYRIGKSRYFVVEADEFNDNFLSINPDILVLTNIEMDHPEYFKDFEAYKKSFQNFLLKTEKIIIANLSDRGVSQVLGEKLQHFFKPLVDFSKNPIDFPLKIPGKFNILNASAAFHTGIALGISDIKIRQSLMGYEGSSRRFEYLGQVNGAKIYSDFAHHPTEIEKTLSAAREKFPDKKIWVIYEPHMFSRTKAFFDEFVRIFRDASVDQIYVVDIYPSREVDTGTVSSKQLVEAIGKNNVRYVSQIKDLLEVLAKIIKNSDIIFFMGAGDIDKRGREFVKNYA